MVKQDFHVLKETEKMIRKYLSEIHSFLKERRVLSIFTDT